MSLRIIKSKIEICAETFSDKIAELLREDKRVLWLVPGGSNIKLSTAVQLILIDKLTNLQLRRLTVALTDERFGKVGHKDSNWQQLIDDGFDFEKVRSFPTLKGLSLTETVHDYGETIAKLFSESDHVIGQFGIGEDGHIAGIIPYTVGSKSQDIAVGYEAEDFTRITLTIETLRRVNSAFAFAFGPNKKKAIDNLKIDGSVYDIPARVLKEIPISFLYTDNDL